METIYVVYKELEYEPFTGIVCAFQNEKDARDYADTQQEQSNTFFYYVEEVELI